MKKKELWKKNRFQLHKSATNEKLGRGQFTFRRKENMPVVCYQVKKKFFYSQPCTKWILLMLDSEVMVMSKSLKLFTTIIQIWGGRRRGAEADKSNEMIGNYSCIRKTYKWYIKIFFHFLEEALYNAFVVCSKEGKKKITTSMLFKSCHSWNARGRKPNTSRVWSFKRASFPFSNTTQQEQRKTSKDMCCLLQKQSLKRISLSLQKLSRSSRIVPCTMFHDIPHSDWLKVKPKLYIIYLRINNFFQNSL